MPYLNDDKPKNCFRCEHLSASEAGYVCGLGFGEAQTIWTGDLALICPLFEEKLEREEIPETVEA
ncbi:MAG TPA: hypothetical protein VGP33_03630 [Chloroflexota bacterium]|jgi:hypothetical protein|nr:hypothetical protein [Chloroflexota bacterium]